ncbi:hypothetical protein [Anoxybacteroides tepidamans]|uniref:hypothetical protein n=1 Tax=Anoxybacteroides tepidamans TaxID=265948 RepID=UPI0004845187|nr:hypothetical protein [Anoxybacillus tepidamans]
MLTYQMVRQLFPRVRGIVDDSIEFHSVFVDPSQQVKKGLFVPLLNENEQLKIAIEHGAIASLWKEGTELPRYVPNQFPIFFVPSPQEALAAVIQTYRKTNAGNGKMTKFYLTVDISHHNAENRSYDIAVVHELQQLEQKWFGVQQKEGCEPS